VPIRIRLTLAVVLATFLIFSLAGFLFLRSFRQGLESSLRPGLRAQASTLAREISAGGPELDLGAPAGALATRDVVAQVLDHDGQVLTTTREAGDRPVIDASSARQAGASAVFTRVRVGREREPYLVLARPVATVDRPIAVVATSLEATDGAVGRVRRGLLIGGAVAVALAGFAAWVLAAAALRPVERMRREAAAISEHDRAGRLQVPATRDEIAALGTTMNELLARLQGALLRQRAFVADAGHELRTPIAVLRTELELAGRPYRSRPELDEGIHHAAQQTGRLQHIADELLFLARSDDGADRAHFEALAVVNLLHHSAAAFSARADGGEVTIAVDGDPELSVTADPELLRRAVDNLLDNALRYAPPGSTITARVAAEPHYVRVEVADGGPGFAVEFLPHAFERFRRADDARTRADGGAGLGLAIVLAVARQHGGTADVANQPAGGALATIRIPRGEV
jgi:heavy metal sensor kinase